MKNVAAIRTIGFVASLLLTLAAYIVITRPELFDLTTYGAIGVILTLAICQATIQFLFFLDVWRETGIHWNLGIFISTFSLILLIILFSIWIMHNLHSNMMMAM